MLTSDDLGLPIVSTTTVAETTTETAPVAEVGPAPLTQGSVTAKAAYEVWSGTPVTCVDSPPGAGKTLIVSTVAAHLSQRSNLSVVTATATRRQGVDLAGRIAEQTGPEKVYLMISGIDADELPDGVKADSPKATLPPHSVSVRTIASCKQSPPGCDVMIVDEAYQLTYADVATAASRAKQILLVGDPGQIGPVVTCDTTLWEGRKMAPHRRAPEVFAKFEDAVVLELGSTWRLGPKTVDAISTLYNFEFDSARPPRCLDGLDEIESVELVPGTGPYDSNLLTPIVDRAEFLVGQTLVVGDGPDAERVVLEAADVAVVVSHNAQAATVGAMLRGRGLEDVTVGTADRMQGGQWHAVVALDPLSGVEGVFPHSLALGRLCVMASRHLTHLTWMHDGRWDAMLNDESVAKVAGKKSRTVRRALCS